MTNDADLDMVASRVSSLESRVASVESQGSPEDAGVKAGQDGAPQPTVDPKGRKIWEAEWRQDYGVLLAYVPDNALVIDGENVEVEADDKDGDEVTVSAGSWYLHVYKNETTGSYEADFDDSETGTRDGEDAKYNIRIFDIHDDGYVEKQYVVGSIVFGKGGVTSLKGDDEDSVKVDGDVEIDGGKSGLTVKTELEEQDGDEPPKAKVTIDVKGRESADGCENTENWGCQPMKLPGGGLAHFLGCRPVDLSNVVEGDGGTGGNTVKRVIKMTGDAQNSAAVNGNVVVKGAQGSGLEILTTTNTIPAGQDADANHGGQMVLDLKGRQQLQNCSKNFGLHTIKYKDKNGDVQIYHVFSCGDIDLTEMGKLIKDVNISCSAAPGGVNTMVFNYTDGSSDTFRVQNGLDGAPGSPGGDDPDDPEPVDPGNDYLTEDDLDEQTVVTGMTFAIENNKLVAKLKRKRIKAVDKGNLPDETVNVCDAKELEVVTGESYDTSSHQFTNTRRKITVMGDTAAAGQTPFTATPHSREA